MPETTVYEGRIRHLSILDENGRFDETLGGPMRAEGGPLTDARVRELYRWMALSRVFDETAVSLQREGRMGTYAECAGQEAVAVGTAGVLRQEDWIFPSYREVGAYLLRGCPPENVFLFWMGDERGHVVPAGVNNFPICIPVGTQTLHAAGAAWAFRIKRKPAVAMCYFGDGATSKGDFHEALNFAGVFRLPAVFVCSNNGWAISVGRERQTAARTIAQKAVAYGIHGVQVDGNDLFAVTAAAREAVERARAGGGATLIEAVTYRMSNHTTADDASRYREPAELEQWRRRDPILRVRRYLTERGALDEAADKRLREECKAAVYDAVKRAEGIARPDRRDIFRHVYAEMPPTLIEQMEIGSVPAAESEGAALAYSGNGNGHGGNGSVRGPSQPVTGEYLPPEPPPGEPDPLTKLRNRAKAAKGG
jgi:pyruvate dehydrogenase E1 component alpha subunit